MRSTWTALALLWFAGVALRLTILAVPPIMPMMEVELRLSGAEIGFLSGLPVALFGIAAIPGSLLIARFGAVPILVAGLVIAGTMSALRAAAIDNVFILYAATAAMGAGIAIMQPALPSIVRQWFPVRVSFATAVYTNGLLVGETLPVAFTVPLVLPLLRDSWRVSLVFWGVPLVLLAISVAWMAPQPKAAAAPPAERLRWWPDWSDIQIWQLALVFGAVNSVYFGTNAFLPGHLAAAGRADLVTAALTALNLCQLPASFAMLAIANRMERRAMPFVLAGVLMLVSIAGIASTASVWTVIFSGALGFVIAGAFTLALALPPLLSAPSGIARMSAAVFTVSYTEALLISVIGGGAADWSGSTSFAFFPIAVGLLPLIFIPPEIRFNPPSKLAK